MVLGLNLSLQEEQSVLSIPESSHEVLLRMKYMTVKCLEWSCIANVQRCEPSHFLEGVDDLSSSLSKW